MFQLGSLLMMIVLTAPMVRDCCLPVTHSLPCHEQKHTGDITCDPNLLATTVNKPPLADRLSLALEMLALHQASRSLATPIRQIPPRIGPDDSPPIDLYIRTGALLI